MTLIVPDFDRVKKWAKEKDEKLAELPKAELVVHPEVHKLITAELESFKEKMKHYEFPQKFKLLSEDFTVENDLLTPKLSLKRRNIQKKYQEDLKKLYGIAVHEQLSYHNIKSE